MVFIGDVVDCMRHLVCCECADTRNSELVCGRQLGWGWGLWLAQDKLDQWFSDCLAEP